MGLTARGDEKVGSFSRGMMQRLHVARGLVSDPGVLILDEPTVGMDPVAAHDFRALVGELRSDGRTILLTTHDMAEAAALSDRVALIDNGRLVLTEDPAKVGKLISTYERLEVVAGAIRRLHLADTRCGCSGALAAPGFGAVGEGAPM